MSDNTILLANLMNTHSLEDQVLQPVLIQNEASKVSTAKKEKIIGLK